jgi:hypothetical protein
MKKLIVPLSIILLSFSVTFGQDAAELSTLRALLGVTPNTAVVSTRTAALPWNEQLKVYVDVSGDAPARDSAIKNSLIRWIDEWNHKDGAEHFNLEIVTEPTQAYVALIQFTDFPLAMDFVSGNASGQFDVNPRTGQPDNGVQVSNTLRMTMIVYTYIVIKEPETLKILYRRKDPLITKTTYLANPTRTSEATAAVRKEIEKEIIKRTAKSQGDKNVKSPEYGLREGFVKWLNSSVSVPSGK